ncbi:hypothetical protein AWN76_016315 [Rhodothermaceae bacterium RA]|nr:hypothetical protein AWN76_016315 [Rhodothermaceae bacterium RA]
MAAWILDHPRLILTCVLLLSGLLGYGALQVSVDHRTGALLSDESETVRNFARAGELFGQSQAILYVVFEEDDPFAPDFLVQLDSLTRRLGALDGVESVLSLTNVPYLVREEAAITARPLYDASLPPDVLRRRMQSQPFLNGLLLSADGRTTVLLVKIEEAFNDSAARIGLVRRVMAEAHTLPGSVAIAGYPYLRTEYAERVAAEAPLFTLLALLVSLVFLFLTFRSWRAVLLPTAIVGLGILWTIGLIGLFGHQLNIVTAVLPALIVIIGMANSIHLMTKFFDQYRLTEDRRQALMYTIRTAGMATLLTSLTTAIGFAVLVLSRSRSLEVFGLFAAAGVLLLYVLSVTLIPIAFVYLRPPSRRTAGLSGHDAFADLFDRLALLTRRRAPAVLTLTALLVAVGIAGVLRIPSDLFVFSDFNEDDPLRQDLAVFERQFGGVLPLEIVIEAKTPGRMRSLSTLRRIERLQQDLSTLEPVGRTLSLVDLVKLSNQAYFGGNPAGYRLPSGYELPFLQSALGNLADRDASRALIENLPRLVDSTFTVSRIYMGVSDIGTSRMHALADTALVRARRLFPAEQYDVFVTGTAVMTTRAGENLVQNLVMSLLVALLVISGLMALLFRSARLTLISLAPNVVPLLLVGGAMGFSGITLKPSTAIIFSLAFGIAVDDTIHFLAKYRLLHQAGLSLDEAVRTTLRETGKAILFTSLVLMSGFLVFTLSDFGGTVSMGALTALTLGAALVANLFLLPALLYRFGPRAPERPAPARSLRTNGQAPVHSPPPADRPAHPNGSRSREGA